MELCGEACRPRSLTGLLHYLHSFGSCTLSKALTISAFNLHKCLLPKQTRKSVSQSVKPAESAALSVFIVTNTNNPANELLWVRTGYVDLLMISTF